MKGGRRPREAWVTCVLGLSGEEVFKKIWIGLVNCHRRMNQSNFGLTRGFQLGVIGRIGVEKWEVAVGVINERILTV